jgi:hypothetical protein
MIFLFVAFCLLCVDERHFSDEWRNGSTPPASPNAH